MRHVPLLEETTSQDSSSSEEEQITRRKKKTLKSGMDCTGATLFKKRINWPHDVLYSADGKPAVYSDLTVAAFVWGYLIVVNYEMANQIKAQMTQHLEELMENTDLYGWENVCTFHAAWLNMLEQGRSTWDDSD